MGDARHPQTDRELLLELNTKVDGMRETFDLHVKQLTMSINNLTDAWKDLEEKKVVKLEDRVYKIEKKQNEMDGGWKTIGIIAILLSIVATIKAFFIR